MNRGMRDLEDGLLQLGWDLLVQFESELRRKLRDVSFVFELGFPDDLVERARAVVVKAVQLGRVGSADHVRFPASVVLSVVSAAREYDGNAFWSSDAVTSLGLPPTKIASVTYRSFELLKIDTFERETAAENALRQLSPVLMHAGIPAANVRDLVTLIASAQRQHLFGAEEQIAAWTRTPNSFRGLWRAPQLFFKYGGGAATDLLDRLNEALGSPDPAASGLPAHLLQAIGDLDAEVVRSVTRSRPHGLTRPDIRLDPWSCDGPFLILPRITQNIVSRWRITGAAFPDLAASKIETTVPLEPQREWEVLALHHGEVTARWSMPAYGDNPVLFFDGTTGKLLRHLRNRRTVDSSSVLALIHPRIEISGAETTGNEFPSPSGRWSNWQIKELHVDRWTTVHCQERGRGETVETIQLVPGLRRTELTPRNLVTGVRAGADMAVYSSAPLLTVSAGAVSTKQISVAVTQPDDSFVEATLDELTGGPDYDLASLIAAPGVHAVAVHGPLGLRLPPTLIALIPGLSVSRTPTLARHTDVVQVKVTTDARIVTTIAQPEETSVEVKVDGVLLRIDVPRITWTLRQFDQLASEPATVPVLLSIDELQPATPPLLSLSLGAAVYSRLELRKGSDVLAEITPPRPAERWTAALDQLRDTVEHASAESLQLVLVAGGVMLEVGRIISMYVPHLSEITCDPSIEPAIIEAKLIENRSFRGRVARLWDLERPWERSLAISIPDTQRHLLQIQLPNGHRASRYRLWLRVEDAWAADPALPRYVGSDIADVVVLSGLKPDPEDPVDRLVAVVQGAPLARVLPGDVDSHGHLLVARLASAMLAHGSKWLSTPDAGRLLALLQDEPTELPRHLARALGDGYISRDNALGVAAAVLPLLLHLERTVDLQLPIDIAEQMWTTLPMAAMCIESWSDGAESCERWSRYIGWPRLVEADTETEIEAVVDLRMLPPLGPEFLAQARNIKGNQAFAAMYETMTGLSDRPLSIDYRFRGMVDALLSDDATYHSWLELHSASVRAAHLTLPSGIADWVISFALGDGPATRWILTDVAAICAQVLHGEAKPEEHAALIDAVPVVPTWLSYCLAHLLATDKQRHQGPLSPHCEAEQEELDA